jgi:POT family proton-dependent oligopeptide transporter
VYLAALPGGWIADRWLGPVPAIWLGGLMMIAGNLLLAVPPDLIPVPCGLALFVAGVGLLRPNLTQLLGRAAREESLQLDSAFTIFYVALNVGGLLGPLIASVVAARSGWRVGFCVCTLGMLLGLAAFSRVSWRAPLARAPFRLRHAGSALLLMTALALMAAYVPAVQLVRWAFAVALLVALLTFAALLRGAQERAERSNIWALFGLFVGASIFWAADEQAGASLTLLAQRFTNRTAFGFQFPAAWYQALFPFYVVLIAPIFAWGWQALSRRGVRQSTSLKFCAGLALGALALTVARSSLFPLSDAGASPAWLALTYLFIALGEILINPTGLAAVSRLAPKGRTGLATGLWYLSLSLGGLSAGVTGGIYDLTTRAGLASTLILISVVLSVASAVFLIVSVRGSQRRKLGLDS